MSNRDHSPQHRAFLAAALCFLLVCVEWPRLAPSCSTAICRSSVLVIALPCRAARAQTATGMGLLQTLLSLLPDSWAASARQYGNLLS